MDKFPIETTEKRTVKRITVRQSVEDFLDAFNVERGLVFTVKMLFRNPGMLIRYYLSEGRFKVVNAFRLLIISTALSLVMMNLTDSFELLFNVTGNTPEETDKMSELILYLFTDWYNLLVWISIPVFALFSYRLFRRYEKFNYAEHLVIQSFIISAANIIVVAIVPIGFIITHKIAFLISFVLGLLFFFYLFYSLYRKKTVWFFLRMILCFFLSYMAYTLVMSATFGALIYFNK